MKTLAQKFTLFRRLTLALYSAILGMFVYWGVIRNGGLNLLILAVQSVPLLVLLPGLLSQYYRVYSWLCFVILLYFVVAVMGAFSSQANTSDFVFLALTVCLFIVSMMCSRYAQRVQKSVDEK